MDTWRRWLLLVHLLAVVGVATATDGLEDRSEIDSTNMSKQALDEKNKEFEVLIIPVNKIGELSAFNKNNDGKDSSLQNNDGEDHPILQAKISPSTLRALHIPQLHVSPKLELLKQRIKLKNMLLKAKLIHYKLTPGILKNTQTDSNNKHDDSSEELLVNILESSNKDTGSKNDILKNTVLTKTTTYNVTHLKNDTKDQEFLITKKEDILVNMHFLDKKGRPTNFTNAQSSSLQTVIDGESDEQESFDPFITSIILDNMDTNQRDHSLEGKKNPVNKSGEHEGNMNSVSEGDETNGTQNNNVGSSLIENASEINPDLHPLLSGENSNYLSEVTTISSKINCNSDDLAVSECDRSVPTDFVSGQFTTNQNRFDPILGSANPLNIPGGTYEMVSGQLIPSDDENNVVGQTSYMVTDDLGAEPGKVEGPTDWRGKKEDLTATGQSTLDLSNNQHTTSVMNYESDEGEPMIGRASSEFPIDKTENTDDQKSLSRSDIVVANEETDDELTETIHYDPFSILGITNNLTQGQSYMNNTNNLKDDMELITENITRDDYLGPKTMDEEPELMSTNNNESSAKSREPHLIESFQLEEEISSTEKSQEDTIIGEPEMTETSQEGNSKEVSTNADHTLLEDFGNGKTHIKPNVELSSESTKGDDSSLMNNHDSYDFITEIVEEKVNNYSKNPTVQSTEVDNVGEPSNIQPNQVNNTLVDNDAGHQVLEEEDLSTHPVELFAGRPLGKGDYSGTDGPYTDDPNDSGGEYLTELCFPLKNNNLSLFDLLSGHFYIEKDGNKIPIHLKDNPMKNCTSATKKCKLYLDLKKDLNASGKEIEIDLRDESDNDISPMNKKRHIRAMHALGLSNNTLTISELQTDATDVMNQTLNSLNLEKNKTTATSRKKELKSTPCSYNIKLEGGGSAEDNNIHNGRSIDSSDSVLQEGLSILYPVSKPMSNQPVVNASTSAKQSSDEMISLNAINSEVKNDVLINQNRYPRTVRSHGDKTSSGGRCTCDSSILQSPSPNLGYQHFVRKRLAILTNIVHAVKDWASDSQRLS